MRVLICSDAVGALSSWDAGAALGRAWAQVSASTQVAVVPLASGGPALVRALADLGDDATVVSTPVPGEAVGVDPSSTSLPLGERLADALRTRPRRVVIDLTGLVTHDAGAGILHALGARADVPLDAGAGGLAGLNTIDLTPARELIGGVELVAVVEASELGDLLLGLRGITARRGHAAGADPADMLATDAALGSLAASLELPDAPGLGAAGGAVLALTALGAWTTSGPGLCAGVASLEATAGRADVIVTGADSLDFATRGGDVVKEAAAMAARVMRPCVAIAREVHVSGRELRTFGIEVAYGVGGDAELDAAGLTLRARGAASSWTW